MPDVSPAALARALGALHVAPQYIPTSVPPVPVERWGRDHWSTFAYLEVRTVDHGGRVEHAHMRCHGDRHPIMLAAKHSRFGNADGRDHPTRLKGGELAEHHDDYDCIDDMIAAGLVTATMPRPPGGVLLTGLIEMELMTRAVYALTDRGRDVAARLRAHKADGGNFAGFTHSEE